MRDNYKCIDCGVCEPECPADAIFPDNAFDSDEEVQKWYDINMKYSLIWPVITEMRPDDVPAEFCPKGMSMNHHLVIKTFLNFLPSIRLAQMPK